uniref:Endonuclease/exonuclease/phosphatase domain-containing protein n=1 Tax=Monopterus albus TaxID=43700 RepID=A0A3Q3K3X3_MONAL
MHLCQGTTFSHANGSPVKNEIQNNTKLINQKSDVDGHWLMIVIELNDQKYILVNVYRYNNRTKNKRIFNDLCTMIDGWKSLYSTDKAIVAGDFNEVPDEWLDRDPTKFTTSTVNPLIVEFSTSLDFINIWRNNNPNRRQYTILNVLLKPNGQLLSLEEFLIR